MALLEPFDHVGSLQREAEQDMVNVGGCKYGRVVPIYKNNRRTGETRVQRCNSCKVCRLQRHEMMVGAAMAEAYMSAAVVLLTLTYADDPETGETPFGAKYLQYFHVQAFLNRLRGKTAVRVITAGEYGGENGRAHWHLVLFFPWDKQRREDQIKVLSEQLDQQEMVNDHLLNWRSRLPEVVMPEKRLSLDEFKAVLSDPEILYLSAARSGRKQTADYKQSWKFWPHGFVNAELLHSPEARADNVQSLNRGVRYVYKYLTKDAWRDDPKFNRLSFSELPEWVKEATAFGRIEMDGRKRNFKGPNTYAADREAQSLIDAESGEWREPWRRRKPEFHHTMRGGLGHDYFRAIGILGGRLGRESKIYSIPGVFERSKNSSVRKALEAGANLDFQHPFSSNRRSRFMMRETAMHVYGQAILEGRAAVGRADMDGHQNWISTLDNRVNRRRDRASGSYGFDRWEVADRRERKGLEKEWSFLSDADAKEFLPSRLYDLFLQTSNLGDWPEKRRRAKFSERYGYVSKEVHVANQDRVYVMNSGKLLFERRLPDPDGKGKIWWQREIETVEQLQLVAVGKFVSEGATSLRRDREGRGDLSAVKGWSATRVKKLVRAARHLARREGRLS